MNMLLQTQTGQMQLEDDDPQLAYMISAWARICKILGKEFEPYLPYVMGPVMKAASIKIEVALLNSKFLLFSNILKILFINQFKMKT